MVTCVFVVNRSNVRFLVRMWLDMLMVIMHLAGRLVLLAARRSMAFMVMVMVVVLVVHGSWLVV